MMGVAQRKFYLKMKYSSFIKSTFWSSDIGMPNIKIVFKRSSSDSNSRNFLILNLLKVFNKPFLRVGLIFFVYYCP